MDWHWGLIFLVAFIFYIFSRRLERKTVKTERTKESNPGDNTKDTPSVYDSNEALAIRGILKDSLSSEYKKPTDYDYIHDNFYIDFRKMILGSNSIIEGQASFMVYNIERTEKGKWYRKLIEVTEHDYGPGKLLTPFEYGEKLYSYDGEFEPNGEKEKEENILLTQMGIEEATHWEELPEKLYSWVEASYQRCVNNFSFYPGITPDLLDSNDIDFEAYRNENKDTSDAWVPQRKIDTDSIISSVDDFKKKKSEIDGKLFLLDYKEGRRDFKRWRRQNINLTNFDLSNSDFSGADLSGTILTNTIFSETKFVFTNLVGADLRGADLSTADLFGATFCGYRESGDKENALYDENTKFPIDFDPEKCELKKAA